MKLGDKIEKFLDNTVEGNPFWVLIVILSLVGAILGLTGFIIFVFLVFGWTVGLTLFFGTPITAVIIGILTQKED